MKIPLFVLPHRATIIPFIGSGAYGPIWDEHGAKNNVPCRIEPKAERVRSVDGLDVYQKAEAIFRPGYSIKPGDKVLWNDIEYTVEATTPIDAVGPHSIEVVLV
jgi:hypothetical protein